jgi:multiple sugar transport system substrate-binding protein
MYKRYITAITALLMILSMVLAACTPATPQPTVAPTQPSAPVSGEFDWRQVEGTKITVFLSETPMAQAIRNHIQEFKDLTGIEIEYLVVGESEYWSKLAIDLSSGAGQFHVFMSGPTLNWGYAEANQIQVLDPFLNDPTLTPKDWNFEDIYPWAIESNSWDGTPGFDGMGKGSLWSLPINQVNSILAYRKDLFDLWGLNPPTTWDEWAAVSQEIQEKTGGTLDGKPFYAVAQRGALDLTTLSGPFFSGFASYGGADFNNELAPSMNSPRSVAFQKLYMDTIKETGSPEWPNMMWYDVQQGFTSGQYAMVFDVGDFVPTYEKEGSAVAGKLAYLDVPAGPEGKRVSHPWTWGFSMNSKTTGNQAKAAWLFIVWASSTEQMLPFATVGVWPTRKSVWEHPDVVTYTNQWGEGTFRTAMDKVLNEEVDWPISPLVDAGAIQLNWVKALHDYYFGKDDMQNLMDGVGTKAIEILKESGTLD